MKSEGIHIRKITNVHVTSIMYHFQHSKNHSNLQLASQPINITTGSCYDYGIFILMFLYYKIHCNSFDCGFRIKHVHSSQVDNFAKSET